jgi:hypothetical protein
MIRKKKKKKKKKKNNSFVSDLLRFSFRRQAVEAVRDPIRGLTGALAQYVACGGLLV